MSDLTVKVTQVDETTAKVAVVGVQGPPGPGVAEHLADTEGAHAASAISVVPFGTIAAINVQDALQEVAAEAGGGITQEQLDTHTADTTDVHGILDTSELLKVGTGAGGVLSGSYPNPGFAVDMAEQGELQNEIAARQAADALLIPLSQKAAADGVATLNGSGKIPADQLGPLAITTPFVVGSQAAMLALAAQEGDVAIRTDINKSFILGPPGDPTVLANWHDLVSPTDAVSSVDGRTGAVDLSDRYAAINDARLSDARTPTVHNILSAHNGFPGGTSDFLRADGAFAAPPSGGGQTTSDYTPALFAATTNPTLGSGSTQTGRYTRQGNLIVVHAKIAFGTSGVSPGNGGYEVTLPVAVRAGQEVVGHGYIYDASAGVVWAIHLVPVPGQPTRVFPRTGGGGTGWGTAHNAPWTWAASDSLNYTAIYEAAA